MGKERPLKWHEEIFTGLISAAIGITLLFNGFSYMLDLVIERDVGPTKQTGIIAVMSMIETSWWKYLIVLVFLLLAFFQIRSGIQKHCNK